MELRSQIKKNWINILSFWKKQKKETIGNWERNWNFLLFPKKLERGYHCGCQKAQCFVKGFNSFCRKHNLNLDIFQLSLHILVPKIYMLPVGTMKNMERTVFNLSKLQLREKSFFLNP